MMCRSVLPTSERKAFMECFFSFGVSEGAVTVLRCLAFLARARDARSGSELRTGAGLLDLGVAGGVSCFCFCAVASWDEDAFCTTVAGLNMFGLGVFAALCLCLLATRPTIFSADSVLTSARVYVGAVMARVWRVGGVGVALSIDGSGFFSSTSPLSCWVTGREEPLSSFSFLGVFRLAGLCLTTLTPTSTWTRSSGGVYSMESCELSLDHSSSIYSFASRS